MTTAREIIARHLCTMAAQGWSAISPFERAAYRTTAAGMVEAVTTAGYRILGPDEVDAVTLEMAARIADEQATEENGAEGFLACKAVEAAIRALASGESR